MNAVVETGGGSGQPGIQLGREPVPDEMEPDREPSAPVQHHGLLQAGQSMLNIIVVALFIITFTMQPFRIPSESMEPTLLVGDFLLVNKDIGLEVPPHVMAPTSTIRRGDLIVFHYPIDSSLHLVKRVIGLPGDHLHLRDGHVYVEGHALSEPYAVFQPTGPDSYRDDFPRLVSADPGVDSHWWIEMHQLVANGELTVPADDYFVLGDNRNNSEDSRYWGFVPRSAIVGKPLLVYFSLNEAGSAPGQSATAPQAGDGAPHREGHARALIDFARWDRMMRIVY